MKTKVLLVAASLAASLALATDGQVIDLGNGATVRVSNGRVSVSSAPGNGGSSSSSVSSTTVNGETVAVVTTDSNGERSVRTITVGPDGKAAVSETASPASSGAVRRTDAPSPGNGGWLGLHTAPVPEALRAQLDLPEGEGLVVEFVADVGPAAKAGVQVHDLLLTLDGTGLKSVGQLREILGNMKSSQDVSLGLVRKGKPMTVKATLEGRPAAPAADSKIADEAARLIRSGKGGSFSSSSASVTAGGNETTVHGKSGRSIIITSDGQTKVIEGSSNIDPFESVLADPNIPEEMKVQIRKAQAEMKKARAEVEKARDEIQKEERAVEPKTEGIPE